MDICFINVSSLVLDTAQENMKLFAALPSSRACLYRTKSGLGHLIFIRFAASQSSLGPNLEAKSWQVSSHGRLCSTRGLISRGYLRSSGYYAVSISSHLFLVHRVVALHFLGPPTNDQALLVHHRDGNPSNNHLTNLEYVSNSQNALYSHACPARRCGGSKTSKPVLWRAVGSQSWTLSPSITQAASLFGVCQATVSKSCHAASSHRGYEFRFGEHYEERVAGEEWRDMIDPKTGQQVPGRQVSSHGRLRLRDGRVSWGCQQNHGYLFACYYLNSLRHAQLVHRLVAAAFLGEPPGPAYTHVNHKDGNKRNNMIENLEYVTPAENVAHRHALAKHIASGAGRKPVESRRYIGNNAWTLHPSMTSASRTLGLHVGNIWACAKGQRRHTGGFEFRMATPSAPVIHPDEEWCDIDLALLLQDKHARR